MAEDEERAIRERAYEIWESEGRPDGRGAEHWNQARAEIHEQQAEAASGLAGARIDVAGETQPARRSRSSSPAKPNARVKKKAL